MGKKPFRCSGVSDSHFAKDIHAASGERSLPLGRLNPVDESKILPFFKVRLHKYNSPFKSALKLPVSPPVGDITINSPLAVRSNFMSGFAAQSLTKSARVRVITELRSIV